MASKRRLFILVAGLFAAGGLLLAAAGCASEGGDGTAVRAGSAAMGAAEEGAPPADAVSDSDASGAGQVAGGVAPAPGAALQGLLDRKIVQTTSVDLEVEEVGRNFQDIMRIADAAGGFVAGSTFSKDDEGAQIADVTIRVPADRYQEVLADIRGMGEVAQESSDASDVTEEYTDLSARLRTLQATEQRYLELLAQAQNINDILTVQDRLDAVRGQIEQVQGRINVLDHLTELATITVHLRPLVLSADGGGGFSPAGAAENAWEASVDSLRAVATVVVAVAVFSWWLAPLFVVIGLGARWWTARRPRPAGA